MKKVLLWLLLLVVVASVYESYTEVFVADKCDARNVSGSTVKFITKEIPSGYTSDDVCAAARTIVKNNISDFRMNTSEICEPVKVYVRKHGGDPDVAIAKENSIGSESSLRVAKLIDICYNDAQLKNSSMDVSMYSLGDFEAGGRACKGVLRVQGGIYDLQGFGECESVEIDRHNGNARYSVVLSEKFKYQGRMPETYTFRGETKPF
ncbi:MAG TPA: hypothetical protein PKJ68_04975 [Candidatus Woesebacteria bacterium]|nr:hypothetical protein [Candidatus Woesebacteria bacterium]